MFKSTKYLWAYPPCKANFKNMLLLFYYKPFFTNSATKTFSLMLEVIQAKVEDGHQIWDL